jgi:hypothetical protein
MSLKYSRRHRIFARFFALPRPNSQQGPVSRIKNLTLILSRAKGHKKVPTLMNIPEEDIWRGGEVKELARARSLLCFWAVRELGVSMSAMARRLNITTVAVSKSVARRAEVARKDGLDLT